MKQSSITTTSSSIRFISTMTTKNCSNKQQQQQKKNKSSTRWASGHEQKSDIWTSTNYTEERQRIREFWLHLSEAERRSLVKVEKEAVLRKMKEQQKHSCNCSVCGKKRYILLYIKKTIYQCSYTLSCTHSIYLF